MSIFSQHSRRSGNLGTCPNRRLRRGGFTLIELLVVSAIIIIITSLFLLRQSKFDSSTILRSLAYSISLSMRQAQVYGISVAGSQTTQSSCVSGSFFGVNCYATGYGLYFTALPNNSYILFADFNNNGRYDVGENIQAFALNNGYTISEICAIDSFKNCSGADNNSGNPAISNISIIFRRPNPDACVSTNQAPSVCGVGVAPTFGGAYVQISARDGTKRSVTVSSTGAIVTQAPNTLP